MRLMRFEKDGRIGVAVDDGNGWCARFDDDPAFPGDVCEVSIEGIGTLRNTVVDEA